MYLILLFQSKLQINKPMDIHNYLLYYNTGYNEYTSIPYYIFIFINHNVFVTRC